MALLYRIESRVFDPNVGRIVKDYGPWHPNKEMVESFVASLYRGRPVQLGQVKFSSAAFSAPTAREEVPTVTESVDKLFESITF